MAAMDAAGVAIYSDQQAIDSTSSFGKAMMQMACVFGELKREMIRVRIVVGCTEETIRRQTDSRDERSSHQCRHHYAEPSGPHPSRTERQPWRDDAGERAVIVPYRPPWPTIIRRPPSRQFGAAPSSTVWK